MKILEDITSLLSQLNSSVTELDVYTFDRYINSYNQADSIQNIRNVTLF